MSTVKRIFSWLPGMDPCLSQVGYMGKIAFFQSRRALLLLQRRVSVEKTLIFGWSISSLVHRCEKPWAAGMPGTQIKPVLQALQTGHEPGQMARTLSLCLEESSPGWKWPSIKGPHMYSCFFLLIITSHSLRPSPPLCGHKWNPCLGQ